MLKGRTFLSISPELFLTLWWKVQLCRLESKNGLILHMPPNAPQLKWVDKQCDGGTYCVHNEAVLLLQLHMPNGHGQLEVWR